MSMPSKPTRALLPAVLLLLTAAGPARAQEQAPVLNMHP